MEIDSTPAWGHCDEDGVWVVINTNGIELFDWFTIPVLNWS